MAKAKKTKTVARQYRQGDIMLREVAKLPKGAVRIEAAGTKDVVLAFGEATGHSHKVEDGMLWEDPTSKVRFLTVDKPTRFYHNTHGPIAIGNAFSEALGEGVEIGDHATPVVYEIRQAREYTPAGIRYVAD